MGWILQWYWIPDLKCILLWTTIAKDILCQNKTIKNFIIPPSYYIFTPYPPSFRPFIHHKEIILTTSFPKQDIQANQGGNSSRHKGGTIMLGVWWSPPSICHFLSFMIFFLPLMFLHRIFQHSQQKVQWHQ